MNYQNYLKRIGYTKIPAVSVECLRELHKAHLCSIPFENLDIHTGKEIILDDSHLENKIINSNRGGFCYELNYLFYLLLKHIGFNVKILSARVKQEDGNFGAEFDHMVLLVNIDGVDYLCDVGFGDSFIKPLTLISDFVQEDPAGMFQITLAEDNAYILYRSLNEINFNEKYSFTMTERKLSDFTEMCKFHQTSPDSHFTKNKLCTKVKENGRVTLINTKLIITEGKDKKEIVVKNDKDFSKHLKEYFAITLE